MSDKKYQVFISSTFSDLIEERKKILETLLMADCIPAGMEAFVATDAEQFEVIKKVIDLCDYYLLIIGKRYGSVNETTRLSYTEMEYDYAIEKGIPVLVFAIDDTVQLTEDKIESDPIKIEKLKVFREKAMNNRLASIWSNISDLNGKLAISIMKAFKEISRPGWQRGVDFDEVKLRREIMELLSENKQLKEQINKKESIIASFVERNDLAFEDEALKIDYEYRTIKNNQSFYYNTYENVEFVEIFKAISINMINIGITETKIKSVIESILKKPNAIIKDDLVVKQILLQFYGLGLIYSKWSNSKKYLYWYLTDKGVRTRNELTFRKKINNTNKET